MLCSILFIENQVFGNDCILFSYEKHVGKDAEISLNNTLIQTKLIPKILCYQHYTRYTYTTNERYSILQILTIVFVTCRTQSLQNNTNTTTNDKFPNSNVQQQIYLKCDLI